MQVDDDAAIARGLLDALQADLLNVLHRHRAARTVEGTPTFGAYLELAALVEVLGALLQDAIATDEERARPWAVETIARLELFVAASASRTH